MGDRIGRRRLLLIGAAAFGAASVLAAYAPGPEWLILPGRSSVSAGATLMPSTLALIRNLFHDAAGPGEGSRRLDRSPGRPGRARPGASAGVLLEHFWWGSVFLINVPFMLLLLVIGPVMLPESRSQAPGSTCSALLLSLAAILPTIHALKAFAADGWTPILLAYLAVGAAAAVVFLWRQGVVRSRWSTSPSSRSGASAARSRSR